MNYFKNYKLLIISLSIVLVMISLVAATVIDIGGKRYNLPTPTYPKFTLPDGKVITPPIDKGRPTTTTTTLPPYNVDKQIQELNTKVNDLQEQVYKLTDDNKKLQEALCKHDKELCSLAMISTG